MAKTYKTERGLKAALKKVLGEESFADSKSGKMTKGWMAIPLKGNKGLRVFMIDATGYPRLTAINEVETLEDYGGVMNNVKMFKKDINVVDIPLEVSK